MTNWISVKERLPEKKDYYLIFDGKKVYTSLFELEKRQFLNKETSYWQNTPSPHTGNWFSLRKNIPDRKGWYLVKTSESKILIDPFRITPIVSLVDFYDPDALVGHLGHIEYWLEVYSGWMPLPE